MRIETLKPSQRVKGRFLLHMEDGNILRVGEREVLDFALYEGKNLADDEIVQLLKSAHAGGLKDKALNLLTRKPVSRRELERKLREWEAAPEEVAEICDRMEELKFLDDARYAHQIVRHYSQKGYGGQKLRAELSGRGVPHEFWEDALSQVEDNSGAIDDFIMKKLKNQPADQKQLKKVSDALMRRGFSWSEIKEGINRYSANCEAGDGADLDLFEE